MHDSTNVYIGSIKDATVVNSTKEDQTIFIEQGSRGPTGPQGIQGPAGPGGALGYYGSFYSLVDQTLAINTAGAMTLGTTAESNGISIVSNSRITFTNAGTYDIQFSAQLRNRGGGGAGETVDIWIAKNGTAIADTATKLLVANNRYDVAAWDWLLTVAANDYIEIIWQTDNAQIVLEHGVAATPIPAIPSVIVTVMQVMYTQQGPQGPVGPTGATGATGATGPQGDTGPQGTQGPQGSQGSQGATGSQGPTGPQGNVGPQGSQGPQGADSTVPGPQGSQGPQGAQGSIGAQGPQGAVGAVGAQGPQGPQGSVGATGIQGPQGSQGSVGAQGPQGPIVGQLDGGLPNSTYGGILPLDAGGVS